MNIISSFFEYFGLALIIINTFLYLLSYKKHSKELTYKLFSLYLICSVIINIGVITLAAFREHNLFLSHYYFILQFIILSFFYRLLFETAQKRLVVFLLVLVLGILIILFTISPEIYFKFNTTEVFITCSPIIVYSVIHLYNSLSKPSKYMYINTGVLIYLTTSTLIFILGDYLSGSNTGAVNNIWFINKVLYVIYLLLIFTEWWKNFRTINK